VISLGLFGLQYPLVAKNVWNHIKYSTLWLDCSNIILVPMLLCLFSKSESPSVDPIISEIISLWCGPILLFDINLALEKKYLRIFLEVCLILLKKRFILKISELLIKSNHMRQFVSPSHRFIISNYRLYNEVVYICIFWIYSTDLYLIYITTLV
jgi:hypothetical protein